MCDSIAAAAAAVCCYCCHCYTTLLDSFCGVVAHMLRLAGYTQTGRNAHHTRKEWQAAAPMRQTKRATVMRHEI